MVFRYIYLRAVSYVLQEVVDNASKGHLAIIRHHTSAFRPYIQWYTGRGVGYSA